jgi:hypothetical protein
MTGDEDRLSKYTVPFGGHRAAGLADLYSLASDLEFAQQAFAVVAEIVAEYGDRESVAQDVVPRALWEAGLISYRRACTGGRPLLRDGVQHRLRFTRSLMDSLVSDELLSDEERATHDRLFHLAEKHVAHRADDDAERAEVWLVLSNPSEGRRVETVGMRTTRPAIESATFRLSASKVAQHLHAIVETDRNNLARLVMMETNDAMDDVYKHARPARPEDLPDDL